MIDPFKTPHNLLRAMLAVWTLAFALSPLYTDNMIHGFIAANLVLITFNLGVSGLYTILTIRILRQVKP